MLRITGENAAVPIGQSEQLTRGYEAAVAAAGGYQNLPPQAIEALTEKLPRVEVDPNDPTQAIAAWLTRALGARSSAVALTRLGSSGSSALVYSVMIDGPRIGVFKVFPDQEEMLREMAALERLRRAGLTHMEAGRASEPSVIVGIPASSGGTHRGGAMLEPARGHFVRDRIIDAGELPAGPERVAAIQALDHDVRRVAQAMAELHDELSSGRAVTQEFKDSEVGHVAGRWNRIKDKLPPGARAAQLEAGLARLQADFRSAKLDATVVHGDAHSGNFGVQDSGRVSVIDTETLFNSVNARGEGQSPAAIDAGRYHESLFTHARLNGLTAAETEQLQSSFLAAYRAATRAGGEAGRDAAMRLYQASWEIIIIERATRTSGELASHAAREAAGRLATIVGVK